MVTRGCKISAAKHWCIVELTVLPRTVRISEIIEETRTVKTFILDDKIDAQPGQFVMLWLPGLDEKPISIAVPDPLTMTVAKVGPFSEALHQCKVGDVLGWRGPFGHPFRLNPDRPVLLVGGGYGAAPLYFLAAQCWASGVATTVALGARRADDLIFVERFRRLGVKLLLATEDGSLGVKGYVTAALSETLAERPAIYACGPEGMLVALHQLCHEHGLPGQLSVERYMKCGFGVCGQCALDDILVCSDGPVLSVEQLDDKQDFGRFHRNVTGRRLPV
jgi:dihydroorotate dehydrogenase electron transfer subunit